MSKQLSNDEIRGKVRKQIARVSMAAKIIIVRVLTKNVGYASRRRSVKAALMKWPIKDLRDALKLLRTRG